MKKRILIEVPGFSRRLLPWAPKLQAWAEQHITQSFKPCSPALTLPSHASLTTGLPPEQHGVWANGSYYRDLNKVEMWPQSENVINDSQRIWHAAKKENPDFKCFKYFFWPGMNSDADLYGNVRPIYYADGRKSGDVYLNRPGLAAELEQKLGPFPLFKFWGPGTSIESSQWILDSASYCLEREDFDLSMIYLPHLDYKQQSHGPHHPDIKKEVEDLDAILSAFIERHQAEYDFIILSSYHIAAVDSPIHINRILRQHGLLQALSNAAGELIDYGESRAFSVSDHQIAQIYVKDHRDREAVKELLNAIDGIDQIQQPQAETINRPDFICYAKPGAWFSYYYWLDDRSAPDFARSVAIHAKCGYDPCEMLIDPTLRWPKLKIAKNLCKKMLGMRYLMDLTPLDASLVKGSHGLAPTSAEEQPICLRSFGGNRETDKLDAADVARLLVAPAPDQP